MDIIKLLGLCVSEQASDLHLSAGLPPMLRINGKLRRLEAPPIEADEAERLLLDMMNEDERLTYKQNLSVDFALEVSQVARFRVNMFRQTRGIGAVFRAIPNQIPTLKTLGLGQIFQDLALKPRGLICITGPTGCGKSTSLAALVDYINHHTQKHIITIEDPIEFTHQSKNCLITQRAVGRDTPNFQSALRAALREDPDVILIGELRDLETVSLALTAAETGHLVLTSLHALSAAKAVDRIVDLFPSESKSIVRAMLSESLQAIVTQTLVEKEGGGRVAAREILIGTSAIRNLIREGKVPQIYSAMQTGAQFGMHTLDQHLMQLVQSGIVSARVAQSQAKMPEQFKV